MVVALFHTALPSPGQIRWWLLVKLTQKQQHVGTFTPLTTPNWSELTLGGDSRGTPRSKQRDVDKPGDNPHFCKSTADDGRWISPKIAPIFRPLGLIEGWSRLHHKPTAPKFPSPPNSWATTWVCFSGQLLESDRHIYTWPNEPHQEGKRTGERFNQTESGRCESPAINYLSRASHL